MDKTTEALTDVPHRMIEGWNDGNATAFAADFAADGQLVEFDGSILQGRDTIVDAQQPVFDTFLKGSRLVGSEVLFARIVEPGVGLVHHRMSVLFPGETEPLPTRQSMQLYVLHWIEERWQIVVLQNARVLSFERAGQLDALAAS